MTNKLAVSTVAILIATASSAALAADKTAGGYDIGGATFSPSISTTVEYDDNVTAEESNEDDDFITKISPSFKLTKDSNPFMVEFKGGLSQALFADNTDYNYLNGNFGGKGRYSVDKTLSFEAGANYTRSHSLPGDDEANPAGDAGEPLPLDVFRVHAAATKKMGALEIKPRAEWARKDYGNVRTKAGSKIDQGSRDRDEYQLGARVGYDINKTLEVFTNLEVDPINYDLTSATQRDADGGNYLVGFTYKPTKDLLGELAVGYMNRNYDKAIYSDISTVDFAGRLRWTYEEGGDVTARLYREINQTTDANTGGYVSTTLSAAVTKTLIPDLVGELNARYTESDYEGGNGASNGVSDREDKLFRAGVNLEYKLTETFSFTTDYTYSNNDSNRNTSDYTKNVVMMGIKANF